MKKPKREFTTIKIWRETLKKLRLVAAHQGKSVVAVVDEMAEDALGKVER